MTFEQYQVQQRFPSIEKGQDENLFLLMIIIYYSWERKIINVLAKKIRTDERKVNYDQ